MTRAAVIIATILASTVALAEPVPKQVLDKEYTVCRANPRASEGSCRCIREELGELSLQAYLTAVGELQGHVSRGMAPDKALHEVTDLALIQRRCEWK